MFDNEELKQILAHRVLYRGRFTTSSATVPADTVCGGLYGDSYWDGCTLLPISGACAFQPRKIVTFAGGGAFGVFNMNNPFTAATGLVDYWILESSTDPVVAADSPVNVASFHVVGNKADAAVTVVGVVASIIAYVKGLLNQVALIKTSTDKLAGATPVVGTTTANWNTATGTSTEAGEDLVTIGADNVSNKVLSLVLDISALTAGAVVTVKMFMEVNGVEKKVYSEGFVRQAQVQGSEPDGLWIIPGAVGIHEALRVEVYSDTSESKAIGYDYMLEVM